MAPLHNGRFGSSAARPQLPAAQLPAFCRTRRPTLVVSVRSLACLQRLVLLVLVFQLSALLLVIAGPVPPRLTPAGTDAGVAPSVTPLSYR